MKNWSEIHKEFEDDNDSTIFNFGKWLEENYEVPNKKLPPKLNNETPYYEVEMEKCRKRMAILSSWGKKRLKKSFVKNPETIIIGLQ